MKKAKLPAKNVCQNPISRTKLSKLPINDVFCNNVEIERPELVPAPIPGKVKVHLGKFRDRDVEVGPENPFFVAQHRRMFSTKIKPRKLKPEPFMIGDIRTIVDVDPLFYEIIEGRPIRQFTDVKRYIREIRGITTFRTDAAFSKDQIIAIEEKESNEIVEYTKILRLYERTKNSFVKCVKQSYARAREAQDLAEKTALELVDKIDQLEAASFDYVKLRNSICHIGANFDILIYYARCLNSLAPPWWRQTYDYVNKIDTMSYIYVEQLTENTNQVKSSTLSTLDGYEITVVKYKGTPHLHLKTPEQLIRMFVSFGEQCLNYMKIEGQTCVLRNNLTGSLAAMRIQFDKTVADIEDYVEMYSHKIQFYEEREQAYRTAFFKLLMGEFQDLYASYDNTKLFTCLQFVNKQVLDNPEDPKDSMLLLMSQLERYYFEVTLELENLDQEIVKTATKLSFARDIKEMNNAFKAERVLKEFDILHKTLFSSFEPPRSMRRPKITWEGTKDNKQKGRRSNV